jgi:hypothetical protein
MAMGRPTIYSQELADLVCHRMATHSESIKKICEMYDDMPDNTTIYSWMYTNPDFSRQFLKAREQRAHTLHDHIRNLSDEIHKHEGVDKDGFMHIDSGMVAAYKMRVAVLQKHIEQINPGYYGNKQTDEQVTSESTRTVSEALQRLIKEKEKDC